MAVITSELKSLERTIPSALDFIRKDPLPDEYRALLLDYPRDGWDSHPGFKQPTKNWLGAHRMFRRLAQNIRLDLEACLDGVAFNSETLMRIYHCGTLLVGNLHGHHHFEDTSYFPELQAADPRFSGGLALLEGDHHLLDALLQDFEANTNQLGAGMEAAFLPDKTDIAKTHAATQAIETLLKRHLCDEEELAVPIILHHRLRG